jgi:AAA domain
MELLENSDIAVSNYAGAGSQVLSNAAEFDITIIDEAGQATEPDALVSLSRFLTPTAVVLFIGHEAAGARYSLTSYQRSRHSWNIYHEKSLCLQIFEHFLR